MYRKYFRSISLSLVLSFLLTTGALPASAGSPPPSSLSNLPGGLQKAILGSLGYPEQKVIASDNKAYDRFGYSVAIDGNTALVGAYMDDVGLNKDQGSAYIFVYNGTSWKQQAQLTASDGEAGEQFGNAVSLSGDTALVGVEEDYIGGNQWQGSAYVFVRNGTIWTQQAKLTGSGTFIYSKFGHAVSLSGDTALVGAYYNRIGTTTGQGAAYVFTRSGATWTQQAQLTASDGGANDYFGWSVALDGDTALVGAYNDYHMMDSAYVFVRSGTIWTEQAHLTDSEDTEKTGFGYSVALDGDTALVGAYDDNVGANENQGSAYVFTRSGTTWTQQAQLTASDGEFYEYFGYSVALDGDTALVGTLYEKKVYFFIRSGTTWTEQAFWTATDNQASFGETVAISGDTALVGAHDDSTQKPYRGSAYFYKIIPTTTATFRSQDVYDGWILESSETSGVGGTMNGTAKSFNLGDNALDKQYRAILSFDTSTLPDNAIVIRVTLKIKRSGLVGTDPFTTHGNIVVDIRKGSFSNVRALQVTDFQREADKDAIGVISNVPVGGWYTDNFSSAASPYVYLVGFTQFRLRFEKDDNDDMNSDYLKFYSGNAGASYQPQLIVEYFVP